MENNKKYDPEECGYFVPPEILDKMFPEVRDHLDRIMEDMSQLEPAEAFGLLHDKRDDWYDEALDIVKR